jgi:hypothetical protein
MITITDTMTFAIFTIAIIAITIITIATITISPECVAHIRPQSVGSEE